MNSQVLLLLTVFFYGPKLLLGQTGTPCTQFFPRPDGKQLPVCIEYYGDLPSEFSLRGQLLRAFFNFGSHWSNFDLNLVNSNSHPDISVAFPTTRLNGVAELEASVAEFGDFAENTTVYFPEDAFVVDISSPDIHNDGLIFRVAAKVQFRSTDPFSGQRQSVNDVWIGKVIVGGGKARLIELHEYLDGRVRTLQALNVLNYDESAPELFPWPTFVPGRENCRARVTHTCSDAPCQPSFCAPAPAP